MKEASRSATNHRFDGVVADLQTFALEDEADNRTIRLALAVALALHLALLAVHFPQLLPDLKAVHEEPKIFVVRQVRFEKPPPNREREIPRPQALKVPVPDPTPDEPEPIRLPAEQEPAIDMPNTDLLVGIPAGPPPADSNTPIIVNGDVVAPLKVSAPPPVYPEIARKARIQGYVVVQAIIDKEGQVTNVKILKGLPMGLDQAAVDAVKRWQFRPATLNGKPLAVYFNLTVNFTIQ